MESDGDCFPKEAEVNENSSPTDAEVVLTEGRNIEEKPEDVSDREKRETTSEENETASAPIEDDEGSENVTDEEADQQENEEATESQHLAAAEQIPELPQQPQQRRAAGLWGIIKALLIRVVFIYLISTLMRRDKQQPSPEKKENISSSTLNVSSSASNLFPKDMLMDMYVYVTENSTMTYDSLSASLFWYEKDLRYGDWTSGQNGDGTFQKQGTIAVSEAVRKNGLLFIHVYFVKSGQFPDFSSADALNYVSGSQCLTKIKKIQSKCSIADSQQQKSDDISVLFSGDEDTNLIPYWNPKITIGLITDHSDQAPASVSSPLKDFLRFVPDQPYYYPLVYFNTYWTLDREYVPVNSSTENLNLTVTYSPLSLFSWRIYPVQSMSSLTCPTLEKNDYIKDVEKMAYLNNGLTLLIMASIFPTAHFLLSIRATINDVRFWNNLVSLDGLSLCCAVVELFFSIINMLYVIQVRTALFFALSALIGLVISSWKMTKILDIKINYSNRLFWVLPRLIVNGRSSYMDSQTRIHDMMAFKFTSSMLWPLVPVYVGYAFIVLEDKNWYSWTISMMHGFLTTFGMLLMVPQIFINYKLKSVAHLPWMTLTYKAIDSFLDSALAFVVQAPSYYRIGFFRHDILFYVYLYQYWIYSKRGERGTQTSESLENLTGQIPPETAAATSEAQSQ